MSAAQKRLEAIDGLQIYGPPSAQRSGVLSFTMSDVHPHDLATILDGEGVCIRAGHHCAQPLMRWCGVVGTSRASFSVIISRSSRLRILPTGEVGSSLPAGAPVLDLSAMRDVRVAPQARTARVAGGATWGDLDSAT